MRPSDRAEQGQALVETALILPLQLFFLLGILQLVLLHHARLATEYAAFRAVRAGVVYRASCDKMQRAARLALAPAMLPSMRISGGLGMNLEDKYPLIKDLLLANNSPPYDRGNGPLLRLNWKITCGDGPCPRNRRFDEQLDAREAPMHLHVQAAFFVEYAVPFAGPVMARFLAATYRTMDWFKNEPWLPMKKGIATDTRAATPLIQIAGQHLKAGRSWPTFPVVASWSMRMQSDPLRARDLDGQENPCE